MVRFVELKMRLVQFIEKLKQLLKISDINVKYSWTEKQAFRRFKARKKKEIVTIGLKQINPSKSVGKYIKASEWNEFLEDPDSVVIDTRNEYEIKIGNFAGALNPHTSSFREFPAWVQKYLKPLIEENPFFKNRDVLYWWNKMRKSYLLFDRRRLFRCTSS